MKRPLEYALWCDCEADEERAVFLHSGRAVETGIVTPIIVPELAQAFLDRASLKAEVERLKAQVLTLQTEYVRQNPFVDPQDEIDELRRDVERMTAERDHARNEFVELAKLILPAPGEPTIDGDKIVTPLSDSPLLRRMTELMITALKSGPGNFHTVTFQTTKDGQEYSLTIQREGGKTPAQKIAELAAENTEYKTVAETLKREYDHVLATNEQMAADARLGRMVRGIPENHGFFLNHNGHDLFYKNGDKRVWACGYGIIRDMRGPFWSDTPEEALERAGVRG